MTADPRRRVEDVEGPWDHTFRLLGERLARRGLEVELCLVGGALMPIAFRADPDSRRPEAMFAPLPTLWQETDALASDEGLPRGWLDSAVRDVISADSRRAGAREWPNVRAFTPSPAYVLAMRCARLHSGDDEDRREVEGDVRYLMRLMWLRSFEALLREVEPYFTERQLPADLERRVARLLE